MIRLFLMAVMSAMAPILIVGAVPSLIVLMAAPPALIYVLAFFALTPMCGLVVWRVVPPVRKSEALGELISRVANAGDSAFLLIAVRNMRRSSRAASLPSEWR